MKPKDTKDKKKKFPQEKDQGRDHLVPFEKGIDPDTSWIEEIKKKIDEKKSEK